MTFNSKELSLDQGEPVEIYVFTAPDANGVTQIEYQYTSSEYAAGAISAPISRSGSVHSLDPSSATLTLTMPGNLEVVQEYLIAPPAAPVQLRVQQVHRDQDEAYRELRWMGRVLNVRWVSANMVEMYCESLMVSLKRMGLQRLHSRTCPYAVYAERTCAAGVGSTVLKMRAGTLATCAWVADTQAGFSGYPGFPGGYRLYTQGYYNNGMIEWTGSDMQRHYLGIDWHNHNQGSFNLMYRDPKLTVGSIVLISPECDKSETQCIGRFNNHLNYGGQPRRPYSNPFNLESLW